MDSPDYLQLLKDNQRLLGEFDTTKVSGLSPQWFWDRWIDLLDFRGDLQIRGNNIVLGRKVSIVTASHIISTGHYTSWSPKYVWIEKDTYIGSRAILYNCHIMEGGVVAIGSVVSNMTVFPYTMVAGNPAIEVGVFRNGVWRRI